MSGRYRTGRREWHRRRRSRIRPTHGCRLRRAPRLASRLLLVGVRVDRGRSRRCPGPSHVELTERSQLVERDGTLAVELEQGEEACHQLHGVATVVGEAAERGSAGPGQAAAKYDYLFSDTHPGCVDVVDRHAGWRLGGG